MADLALYELQPRNFLRAVATSSSLDAPVVYVTDEGTVQTQRLFDLESSLFFGDNLEVMRRFMRDESVDLIYLDPPFNSNATYNMLFRRQDGTPAAAQVRAFDDTWQWNLDSERALKDMIQSGGPISRAMQSFYDLLGKSDMLAYLAMMGPRLVELRRVLRVHAKLGRA